MIGRAGLRGAAGDATDAPWATPSDLHVDDRYDDLLAPRDDPHTRAADRWRELLDDVAA